MGLYRKKPVVVEAKLVPVEHTVSDSSFMIAHGHIVGWFIGTGFDDWTLAEDHGYNIGTLEGVIHASPGDWIIRGVQGEFYPCKPDIFEQTYEAA